MSEGQAGPEAQAQDETPRAWSIEDLGTIESSVAGRTRLRLKPELRTPEMMAQVQAELNDHEHVGNVEINPRTGSVVIEHAKNRPGLHILKEALGEAELIGAAVLEVPESDEDGEDGGGDRFAKLDQQLADLVYKVDYHVWKRTGLHFRGQILAGTVAGLGIAQIAAFGISLEVIPGPLLLWIAWDIYHREAKEPPFEDRYKEGVAAEAGEAVGDPIDAMDAGETVAAAA